MKPLHKGWKGQNTYNEVNVSAGKCTFYIDKQILGTKLLKK